MCDGEWTELHLEGDDALERFVDGVGDGSLSLIGGDVLRDAAEDTEGKGAGAGGRIGDCYGWRSKTVVQIEARTPKCIVYERNQIAIDRYG